MRRHAPWRIPLLGLLPLLLLLGGCGSTKSSRFYTLNPVTTTNPGLSVQPTPPSTAPSSVAILPVEIPDYLDRPQIVTRNPNNGLEVAEFDRWAGDLQRDIARVLAETMSARLPENSVFVMTGSRAIPADYRVVVHVTRFDPTPGDAVVLKAVWTVLGKDGRRILARGESNLSEPIQGRDYDATVAAMSRTVDRLGMEIAGAMQPMLARNASSTHVARATP